MRLFVGKTVLMKEVSTFFFRCRFKAIISAVFTESGLLSFTAFNLNIFPLEHFACHVMHVVHCATPFKCESPFLGGINFFLSHEKSDILSVGSEIRMRSLC